MANLPLRTLGAAGVITDPNPYDLPPNAFSNCSNVMFEEGKVLRAPVFKRLFEQTTQTAAENTPLSAFNYDTTAQGGVIGVALSNSSVYDYANGNYANVTPGSAPATSSQIPYSHTQISGLSVLSRSASEPYIRNIGADATYSLMSVGDWPTADRAAVMRTYKDFLVALNVTQGGVQYDTMVKWTDPVPYKATLASEVVWTAGTTNSAGSNILQQVRTPIVDGLNLGNVFIIYSSTESIIMEYTGSTYIFSFKELFDDDGVINKNCLVNTGREHYVFGDNDIYVHNGITKQSIADARVRKRIYSSMSRDNKHRFFAHHNLRLNLIYFCYVSDESDIGFVGAPYCNRAAIYNVTNNTWSFMDLPNVVGAAETNVDLSSQSYASMTEDYSATNVAYAEYADTSPRTSAFVTVRNDAQGLTTPQVYASDLLLTGLIDKAAASETLKTAFVERLGIDLDETQAPLRSYKQIISMIPQVSTTSGTDQVVFKIGSTDMAHDTSPTYVTTYTYTPNTDYKIDTKASGRLLAYRCEETQGNYFNFSGVDFEIDIQSGR